VRAAAIALAAAFLSSTAVAATPHWTLADAQALSGVIARIDHDGLDPADYDRRVLDQAISGGESAALDATALGIFQRLASDMWQGHVRGGSRIGWHINGPIADREALDELTTYALTGHRVAQALDELAPRSADYRQLKAVLAHTPLTDRKTRMVLRANMERWRWMPRDLGQRYVFVNAASFTAELIDKGKVIATHRVIVGKPASPTPQFAATITGVILNPWWEVSPSIVAESIGQIVRSNPARARALGYVAVATEEGGVRIRQAPGPQNALGQMKLVMPNPFTVYLHDTPSKALFDKASRAFSHGCIRTDKPIDFAAALLAPVSRWNRAAIDMALATGKSTKVDLAEPIPVYITYLTARPGADGKMMTFGDIYGRDDAVIAALADREGEAPGE
jgi:L,D-transpeptidase YcbB